MNTNSLGLSLIFHQSSLRIRPTYRLSLQATWSPGLSSYLIQHRLTHIFTALDSERTVFGYFQRCFAMTSCRLLGMKTGAASRWGGDSLPPLQVLQQIPFWDLTQEKPILCSQTGCNAWTPGELTALAVASHSSALLCIMRLTAGF